MAKSIIEVKNLKKDYGDTKAVDGISFSVAENEIFGILGPNGAGKTTTFEMIEGLRKADSGSIEVAGINSQKHPKKVKEVIGVQLQSSEMFDHLSLFELVNLYGRFYKREVDAIELLDRVNLEDKKDSEAQQLSGGQKQRLSIAMALVNDPKVLFLDEPSTGLDPQARRNLWELIKEIRDQGKTILLTTHYMDEAEYLCDRIAVMDGGKIISLDTPDTLINDLLERGFKKEVEVKPANLEDVFIDLTGRKLRD
ncbi:MAG TPA: ABC transporter ATP-binding protein [bacterium]|nr:ABC transporter ATP-binding protein [bacterium]